MVETHDKVQNHGASYAQQYLLKKGLQKFGKKGSETITKELDQLHKRSCFVPVDVFKLTSGEKKKVQHALMLLAEKRDGSFKGWCVYNRKPTRLWLAKFYGVHGKHYAHCDD
jgi:regulator of RNase E activity RraB